MCERRVHYSAQTEIKRQLLYYTLITAFMSALLLSRPVHGTILDSAFSSRIFSCKLNLRKPFLQTSSIWVLNFNLQSQFIPSNFSELYFSMLKYPILSTWSQLFCFIWSLEDLNKSYSPTFCKVVKAILIWSKGVLSPLYPQPKSYRTYGAKYS